MIDSYAESMLVSGGDCPLHWHSSDREATHEKWLQYLQNEEYITLGSGSSDVPRSVDYVLVDTTAGSATLMLPDPRHRLSVTILRTSASNTVTIDSPSGTINGAATYVIPATAFAFAKFKALGGNYYVVG